jgi:hypothetical protein
MPNAQAKILCSMTIGTAFGIFGARRSRGRRISLPKRVTWDFQR